jgi:hypothetical protein
LFFFFGIFDEHPHPPRWFVVVTRYEKNGDQDAQTHTAFPQMSQPKPIIPFMPKPSGDMRSQAGNALAAAIVATTLNPMDYLTNARGSTRPNAFQGADTCYSSHTIGMHPAQKASACASLADNEGYQAAQAFSNGFFQPPYNM